MKRFLVFFTSRNAPNSKFEQVCENTQLLAYISVMRFRSNRPMSVNFDEMDRMMVNKHALLAM